MKWTLPCTFGLIADTHGLLRPEAVEALRGVDGILHAGDIGPGDILRNLRKIAPIVAVEGNIDGVPSASKLPSTEVIGVGRFLIYLIHDLKKLDLDPGAAGFAAVVSGHSHAPSVERHGGILYVNPGGAGPRRANLPVTVGRLHVEEAGVRAEIVTLEE